MPSEFASDFAEKHLQTTATVHAARLTDDLDQSLEDVRDLLNVTKRRTLPDGPCWCALYVSLVGHTDDCERTRAVFRRLGVKGSYGAARSWDLRAGISFQGSGEGL